MPGTWKNRILDYAPPPPTEAWPAIASRLDEEFHAFDSIIAAKLAVVSILPPEHCWTDLEAQLGDLSYNDEALAAKLGQASVAPPEGVFEEIVGALDKPRARVITLPLKRLAIAVSAVAAVLLFALYFFRGHPAIPGRELATLAPRNTLMLPNLAPTGSAPSPANSITIGGYNAANALVRSTRARAATTASFISQSSADTDEIIDQEAGPSLDPSTPSDLQPVRPQQNVSVPAQRIRDAGGNIIMDLSLITHPGDPYITVTSPNGVQTKISSKFLSCLTYLSDDGRTAAMNDDGSPCIDKFKAWRDKFLSDDSFITSAGSFFDIFEMKDLIEE